MLDQRRPEQEKIHRTVEIREDILSRNNAGAAVIRRELRQKGVDPDTIESAISSVDEEDRMDGALKAGQRAARGRDLTQSAERQKVIAALARRGYDYAIARAVLEQLMEDA